MSKLEKWWNTPSQSSIRFDFNGSTASEQNLTNGQVLCRLTAMNGFDPFVKGWGVFEGEFGLDQNQALTLIDAWAYVRGLADGGEEIETLQDLLNQGLNKIAPQFS